MLAGLSGSSKAGVLSTASVWPGRGELGGAMATCRVGAKGLSSWSRGPTISGGATRGARALERVTGACRVGPGSGESISRFVSPPSSITEPFGEAWAWRFSSGIWWGRVGVASGVPALFLRLSSPSSDCLGLVTTVVARPLAVRQLFAGRLASSKGRGWFESVFDRVGSAGCGKDGCAGSLTVWVRVCTPGLCRRSARVCSCL